MKAVDLGPGWLTLAEARALEEAGIDEGYSWWPSWAGRIEELGYTLSEDGHPWLTLAGGLLFLGLLMALVGMFSALAPVTLP